MTEIVKRGISSFKIFLAYKGAFGVNDEELYQTLRLAKKLGVIITAHCENADLVLELQKKLLARGQDRPGMASREPAAAGRGRGRASSDDLRRSCSTRTSISSTRAARKRCARRCAASGAA